MKFSAVSAIALAGVASAGFSNVTTITTEKVITSTSVVESYTTYCPESTVITEGTKVITVTSPGTITITDCPCTRTHTYTTLTTTVCPISSVPVETTTVKPAPPVKTTTVAPAPPVTTKPVSPNVTITTPAHGGAGKVTYSGAVAGVVAIAAYLL